VTIRNLEAFFHPGRIEIVGTPADAQAQAVLANLGGAQPPRGDGTAPAVAVVADPAAMSSATVRELARSDCHAIVWPCPAAPPQEVLEEARRHTTRILGPHSMGVQCHHGGVQASMLPPSRLDGTLALIAQSQSVAATAMDWARGRNIGFSWVAVTGAECDVDVADLLDYAALDHRTRAVAVEIGLIRNARKFMSAARACARAKPVVVLQTRPARSGERIPDPVRSAAFARAGMVECHSLPGLFDALAALNRLPQIHHGRVLVVSNGTGTCALGAEAATRHGLTLVQPQAQQQAAVRALVPNLGDAGGGADLGDVPAEVAVAALREYLKDQTLEAVVFLHAPLPGASHEALAAALVAAQPGPRLLTVWLGLDTALPARRLSADGGIATFTSPDAAARALRYRWDYFRNRELLTQTPAPTPGCGNADELAAWLRRRLRDGAHELRGSDARHLADACGLPLSQRHRDADTVLDLSTERHPELGLHLSVTPLLHGLRPQPGHGFMPLDNLLATRLLADAGVSAPESELTALAAALTRIGQFGMQQASLAALRCRLFARGSKVCCERHSLVASLTGQPGAERSRLVLAPYPVELTHSLEACGTRYIVRPVRPDDEPAVIRLLQSLDPETVRLRFFGFIRHFSHEMAARMTQIDYDRELALVVLPAAEPQRIVGMGTLVADPNGTRAEFAVLVDRAHLGLGLGRHMLEQFLAHARHRSIGSVFGEVLAENRPMLQLSRKLGMSAHRHSDDPGCVKVEIETAPA
jgi:RimJ/RimL family protein N-acetyltransferase